MRSQTVSSFVNRLCPQEEKCSVLSNKFFPFKKNPFNENSISSRPLIKCHISWYLTWVCTFHQNINRYKLLGLQLLIWTCHGILKQLIKAKLCFLSTYPLTKTNRFIAVLKFYGSINILRSSQVNQLTYSHSSSGG